MATKLIVGGLFCITFVMHILFTKIDYNCISIWIHG